MLDSKAEYVTKSQGLEDKSDLITRHCQGLAFSVLTDESIWYGLLFAGAAVCFIFNKPGDDIVLCLTFSHLGTMAEEDTGSH